VSPASETLLVAEEFARILERVGIPHLLGGSLASAAYGEARATLDADFAVHMTTEQAARLASALQADYHVQAELLLEAAVRKRMANVFHKHPFVKIDLHVRDASGHSLEEMRRAQPLSVGSTSAAVLRVATAEDVVLRKLRWFRDGDEVSEQQWRDVLGVLKRRAAAIDVAYMRKWARTMEVDDLLERALAESSGT
jgi:hypothetical protein